MAEPSAQSLPRRPQLRRRFLSVPTLVSFLLVAALVGLLLTRFDVGWGETADAIRHGNPWWLLLAVLIHYTTFLFRGARWRLLLVNAASRQTPSERPPSTLYCGALILMAWFANSVTWFRLGDAYRAYAYADDTGTGFPRVMGTVLAERIVDLGVVFVVMTVAITALYVGGQVRPSPFFLLVAAALLAGALAGLLAMYLLRRWVTPRLPQKIGDTYQRFHAGTMGSFGRLHLVFLLGLLGWLAEVGRLLFVLKALGITISTGLLFFVPMANGLLTVVPLTPGGLGIVETSIAGLLMFELVREEAVAAVLLDRSISYLSIIVTGGIALAVRHTLAARRALRKGRTFTASES